MTPFPLPISELLGHWGAYVVYLLIGFGFGFVLEMSGFGNSKKLAAQFYFKDLTVLKVMFGAIVTAMLLIFLSVNLGLLDYNLVWVNPTYLWPGIVGGLIMGVGFIVGGFCPGTSLVAAATAKLDGIFFALGVFFGIFLFGETVDLYAGFFNSSYMGRFTLPQLLNLDTGVVVLLVTLMALFMFWGAEQLERIVGKKDPRLAPRWRYPVAAGTFGLALLVFVAGRPGVQAPFGGAVVAESSEATGSVIRIPATRQAALEERQVQIHPGELLTLLHDDLSRVRMLDVRSESDFNQFHILDAEHLPLTEVANAGFELRQEPANTVFVLMSNDEAAATEAWRIMVAESVVNVYILEGGINKWIDTFADEVFKESHLAAGSSADSLRYDFNAALGSRFPAAEPDPHQFELEYTPKVELKSKRGPSGGGCG